MEVGQVRGNASTAAPGIVSEAPHAKGRECEERMARMDRNARRDALWTLFLPGGWWRRWALHRTSSQHAPATDIDQGHLPPRDLNRSDGAAEADILTSRGGRMEQCRDHAGGGGGAVQVLREVGGMGAHGAGGRTNSAFEWQIKMLATLPT